MISFAGLVVDVEMALARAVDAIGPVQAGVEPLRRVGGAFLRRQHVAMLVVEGAGVILAVEIAALPAPIGPGAGEAVEHLAGGASRSRCARLSGSSASAASSGTERHSQDGDGVLLDAACSAAGTPALRKYFWARMSAATWLQLAGTSMSSSRNTTEPSGFLISLVTLAERDPLIGRLAGLGEPALNTHFFPVSLHWLELIAQLFPRPNATPDMTATSAPKTRRNGLSFRVIRLPYPATYRRTHNRYNSTFSP